MNFDLNTLQALQGYELPEMKTETAQVTTGDFPLKMVSNKKFTISYEDRPFLYKEFNPRQIAVFNATRTKGVKSGAPEHVFNNAEYYAETNKFFFSEDQVRFMKQNPKEDITLNAYGLENDKVWPAIFRGVDVKAPSDNPVSFEVPKEITVKTFADTTYIHQNKDFFVLYINLPYEYYKDIYMPEKLYQYDEETKQTLFCFKDTVADKAEIQSWFDEFIKGEYEPPVMKIKNGTITAVEWMVPLIFAKYLQIPYLPAVIVIDGSEHEFEFMTPEYTNKELANKVFGPYLWIR